MAGGSKQRRRSSNNHRRRETSDRKQKKEGKRPRRLCKLVTKLGRWLMVTVKRWHGESSSAAAWPRLRLLRLARGEAAACDMVRGRRCGGRAAIYGG